MYGAYLCLIYVCHVVYFAKVLLVLHAELKVSTSSVAPLIKLKLGGWGTLSGYSHFISVIYVGAPKCHFFKSFFMNFLLFNDEKYNYAKVERWTTPKKLKNGGQESQSILDCDIVFFSIHLDNHWVLAAAHLSEKKIVYYDSLMVCPSEVCHEYYLVAYFCNCSQHKIDMLTYSQNGCNMIQFYILCFLEGYSRQYRVVSLKHIALWITGMERTEELIFASLGI